MIPIEKILTFEESLRNLGENSIKNTLQNITDTIDEESKKQRRVGNEDEEEMFLQDTMNFLIDLVRNPAPSEDSMREVFMTALERVFEAGTLTGFDDGYDTGHEEGYSVGTMDGYNQGHGVGFYAGLETKE